MVLASKYVALAETLSGFSLTISSRAISSSSSSSSAIATTRRTNISLGPVRRRLIPSTVPAVNEKSTGKLGVANRVLFSEHTQNHRGFLSFSSSASSSASATTDADGTTESENEDTDGDNSYYGRHIRSYDSHYINGKWTTSSENSGLQTIDVIDPSRAKAIATVPRGSKEDTLRAIEAALRARLDWSHGTTLRERLDYARVFLERFRSEERIDEIVDRLSAELGCTKSFARNVQVMAPIFHTHTLLELLDNNNNNNNDNNNDDAFAWEEAAGQSTVVKEPIGVVGAITPWNYPLNQIVLKVVPALIAGCTVVLKPSEVTPLVAYSFAEALDEAGLPDGVFNMVMGTGPECGQILAEHPGVDLVSFTGSTAAGQVLSGAASSSERIKALRMELGGKSAAVLLDDADFERTVPAFVKQLTSNTGQSCNALSRMLVPRESYGTVLEIASKVMQKEVIGCPTTAKNPEATLGPLVSEAQYNRVRSYIERGVAEGATVVTGGLDRPVGTEDSPGYFVKPTLFGDVTGNMAIAQEEIFGPVLCVIPYDTEEEAIALANGTPYGLNSAVASRDTRRALRVASRLESGMVMVNTTNVDFKAPFGGYKQSGNAREWGLAGLEEFLITKTVNIPLKEYRDIVYGD